MATPLEREFLRAHGRDAVAYLHSMVSNDVASLAPGDGVYALLLTPKARIIADLEVFRTGDDELVLACEPGRGEDVRAALLRSRFRSKVAFEPAVFGVVVGDDVSGGLASLPTPAGTKHLLAEAPAALGAGGDWEVARVEAGLPRYGREFDERSMPAEAGLVPLAVSFTKGCYPGQEPVARLQYRGHANRGLRGLSFDGAPAEPGTPVVAGEREVGRVTTSVRSPRLGPIALAVLRREVADGDVVVAGTARATVRPLPFDAA